MFIGSGSAKTITSAATTGTVNSPTGVATGDLEIETIYLNNATSATFVPPAGWTAIPSCASAGNTTQIIAFSHVAASEGATIAAITWTGNGTGFAQAYAYRNASAVDVCAANNAASSATQTTAGFTAAATTDYTVIMAIAVSTTNFIVNTNPISGLVYDGFAVSAGALGIAAMSYPIASTAVAAQSLTSSNAGTWATIQLGLTYTASTTAGAQGAATFNQFAPYMASFALGNGYGYNGNTYSLAIANSASSLCGIAFPDSKGVLRSALCEDQATHLEVGDPGAENGSGQAIVLNGKVTFTTDNPVSTASRMSFPSFVDATAATTTVPYGCSLTTKAVTFENVQFTVTSVTQSVAPSLSLCDTGTAANPSACGTTIVNSGTFTAAGNISLTSMTNANVAAGHFVCTFFAAGTATVVIAQATGTARPQ